MPATGPIPMKMSRNIAQMILGRLRIAERKMRIGIDTQVGEVDFKISAAQIWRASRRSIGIWRAVADPDAIGA